MSEWPHLEDATLLRSLALEERHVICLRFLFIIVTLKGQRFLTYVFLHFPRLNNGKLCEGMGVAYFLASIVSAAHFRRWVINTPCSVS